MMIDLKDQVARERIIDLTGKSFGRWTVKFRDLRDIGSTRWFCVCDCGEEKSVIGESLRRGLSQSCGCLKVYTNHSLLLPKDELLMRRKLGTYKHSAKERKHEWSLSDEYARSLLTSPCFYCDKNMSLGIDRIDNVVGYTVTNSRPCCKICNYAKNTMTEEEFFAWVERVYEKRHNGL